MSQKPAGFRTTEENWRQLIGRIAQGDQPALAALYDETSRWVYALSLRILGDTGAAEEATLDVYMQVWRQAGSYDRTRGNPSAWLLTLARSRAIDRLRSAGRAKRQDQTFEPVAPAASGSQDPEESVILAERRRFVQRALAGLSSEQREVIEIAYFSGLSHGEIAEKLGQPLGTIKTRIRSGMMKLRELLEPLKE